MARQSTLNVSLTPPLHKYVQSKLANGQYGSASEVIRDGLRALQQRDRLAVEFWADARAKLAVARGQVARGQTVDGEDAMARLLVDLQNPPSPRRARRKSQ